MNCTTCGAPLKPDSKFCMRCGAKVIAPISSGKQCPNCGNLLKPDSQFCMNCGTKVAISQPILSNAIPKDEPPEKMYMRAVLLLEAHRTEEAYAYFEHLLNRNPEDANAYLGKLMVELGIDEEQQLGLVEVDYTQNPNYKRAYRYGDAQLQAKLAKYVQQQQQQGDEARKAQAYQAAMQAANSGQLQDATAQLVQLGAYRDAPLQLEHLHREIKLQSIRAAYDSYQAGDILHFGKYDWIVLEKLPGTLLLFSKTAVCERPYHNTRESITWEQCNLRHWLNSDFLNATFSEQEKALILSRQTDSVFVFSMEESLRHTELIGANLDFDGWWWLRTQGKRPDLAMCNTISQIKQNGVNVAQTLAVCPAFYLQTN